jgi:hypothetical protein
MFVRAQVFSNGLAQPATPGQPVLSQLIPATNTTAGSATLTADQILSGHLQRSGPAAGFTDTWPSADSIVSAMLAAGLGPQVGDQFRLIYQNTVAFAMTYAAGTGIVTGTGTLNCAASSTRIYFHTLLATKPGTILVGNTVNSGDTLTGFTAAQIATVMPGMGVSGTGIAASSYIIGVNPDTGVITLNSGGVTADGSNIALTFFPRIRLDSIGVLAA